MGFLRKTRAERISVVDQDELVGSPKFADDSYDQQAVYSTTAAHENGELPVPGTEGDAEREQRSSQSRSSRRQGGRRLKRGTALAAVAACGGGVADVAAGKGAK